MQSYQHPGFFFSLLLILALLVGITGFTPTQAATPMPPSPTYAIPTPLPRVYSQAAIEELKVVIKETYGIGFASEEEWQAASASEIMWFTDGLHNVLEALNIAAFYLHRYGNAPADVDPITFFRQHFDRANIKIDRALSLGVGFDGNTLPVYEDEKVVGYVIQLAPGGLSSHFILIHELGHVLDGLLEDQPNTAFVDELGGEWSESHWIPGQGYIGNEILFPRAYSGPNEDFADTFGQMMSGVLSPERVAVRYDFMLDYLPEWLAAVQELPEDLLER